MRGDNICIWKLEKSIEEIIPLLGEVYSKEVDILEPYNISENDKKMLYRWGSIGGIFNINETSINGTILRYINAAAEIEVNALPKSQWIVDGVPLPKEIRVNNSQSRVWIIEWLGATYCIIKGSKSSEGRIRSNLMESNKHTKSRWGSIDFRQVPGYTFDKHFYYWLIKNKNIILKVKDKVIQINDVRGFKSDADRKENSYSGEGSNIDSEIPLKSLVSMDVKLISLYIDVTLEDISYNFFLDYDGRLSVNRGECGNFNNQESKTMEFTEIILNIYYKVIPLLISGFNKAKTEGWLKEEYEFKKQLSLEVIADLIKQNNIDIKEIEQEVSVK